MSMHITNTVLLGDMVGAEVVADQKLLKKLAMHEANNGMRKYRAADVRVTKRAYTMGGPKAPSF